MPLINRAIHFSLKIVLATILVTGTVGVIGVFHFFLFVAVLSTFFSSDTSEPFPLRQDVVYGNANRNHELVSLPITGLIVGDETDIGDPLGVLSQSLTLGYDIKKQLTDLADENDVSGVILEINSPGGTIYGAQAIADGVAHFREKTGKPVYAFVSGLAASGGYWAAVAADQVLADAGTSIGSIGVISGPFQFFDTVVAQDQGIFSGGVVTQKGIETIYITAGKSKDLGNPYRRLTPEETESLQRMVNREYDLFVQFVSERRKVPTREIVENIGALLYDGKTAKENHMIDAILSRDEAYDALAKAAGVELDDYYVTQYLPQPGIISLLLQSHLYPRDSSVRSCSLTQVHLAYHGDISSLCD